MTPAARAVVEAVHAGAVLTMHYRPKDGVENERCFVLEPRGRRVFAPTAILAVRSGHLKAADDGLPGLSVTQTWTAGDPLPPAAEKPPFIAGSNVRDTMIPGLTVSFDGDVARIALRASGERICDPFVMTCGRRTFVARVNDSDLASLDWSTLRRIADAGGPHRAVVKTARVQIDGSHVTATASSCPARQRPLLLTWTKVADGYDLSACGHNADRVIPGGRVRKCVDKWRAIYPLSPGGKAGGGFSHELVKTHSTALGAMRSMQREMDRRSIGLWGVDEVNFEVLK